MNLLELYNNETIHMEKHPVSQLIGKVAELEKYHLKEQGITLETRSDDTVLLMDMDLMESLLVNRNMHSGGRPRKRNPGRRDSEDHGGFLYG